MDQPAHSHGEGSPKGTARRLLRELSDLLLAQDCLLCGAGSGNSLLCHACAADLPQLSEQCCPQCALPTPFGERCGRCIAQPPHFDATLALHPYAFPVDVLIQSFKYGHRLAPGAYFGAALAQKAAAIEADLVVPLPLHAARLRERGFNQALELARTLASARGWPLDTRVCTRQHPTSTQANLPWRERAANVRNAFHCTRDLAGLRIVLVDDVMTTGASLSECARTLKLHGAAQVSALVVARALPPDGAADTRGNT
ncbi:ComF family protein [Rhodocyclus tenuis]|uniref:ComF family protein n=1 Tax=Rhodocyclus tenuis TaxID=1066 RepID=A0A840GFV0_RHOTE|nr:ComF family protein [Rhodocyclus tenuis]MBB4247402.1 ComF family protein [Rhodocyclus tenuis]